MKVEKDTKKAEKTRNDFSPSSGKKGPVNSPKGFCIGIGASAGGLEAMEELFKKMKPDSGLSFVIVQHLSPHYKSLMVELLSRYTSMKVIRAENGMKVLPDCIYLIPPRKNMTISQGQLYLSEKDLQPALNRPIDIFFRSLADDYAEKAIGIILSGTGSDGTLGIRAIKGNGGTVLAQDPNSAKFDGMPKSAIATGLVDYVVSAEAIPETLINYVNHPLSAINHKSTAYNENALVKILSIIKNFSGVDFTFYKPSTIIRRLERRITINQISNYENYVSYLLQSDQEVQILYQELLIGVTRFFRDSDFFDLIAQQIIPALLRNRPKEEPIRFWSVACSTGEEAYSLAILLKEYCQQNKINNEIKIFATDIDKDAIKTASLGFYPESISADVSPERLRKYFIRKNKGFQVRESVKKLVIFAAHNVIKDPPFSKIDLLSCRNMLIYLKPAMQKKVLSLFQFSLNPNAILFLGSSESLGELAGNFTPVDSKMKIYRYNGGKTSLNLNEINLPVSDNKAVDEVDPDLQDNSEKTAWEFSDNIYNAIINEFLPPSILIDSDLDILHIYKDVNHYIKLPSGRVTYDIITFLHKDIATTVALSIRKAFKTSKEVICSDLMLKENADAFRFDIRIRPLPEKYKNKKLALLLFIEKSAKTTDEIAKHFDLISPGIKNSKIEDIEMELQYTRKKLVKSIIDLGKSHERLQTTNEELVSSNEELQSTNEELQSVNQELYTVNNEYQNKIELLTQLNNDFNNLLKNTSIGIIILDRNLLIRKFTPAVTSAINILEFDIGRPIHHIAHHTHYQDFIKDIENVLHTLTPKDVEIQGKNNNWFLLRINPYRTLENAVDGVVVTCVDITERKAFEESIEGKSKLVMSLLENSPIGSIMLDRNGHITFANKMAEMVLNFSLNEFKGNFYASPLWQIRKENGTPFTEHDKPHNYVIVSRKPVFDVIHLLEGGNGYKKLISINASPVFDQQGHIEGVICSLLDITEKKWLEDKFSRNRKLMIRIMDNSHQAMMIINPGGSIEFYNEAAAALFELPLSGTRIINLHDLLTFPGNLLTLTETVFKTAKATSITMKLHGRDPVMVTASPSLDEQHFVYAVILEFKMSK
jgi:two-component system, chemotaxis family, CheB/CheR fusion protein